MRRLVFLSADDPPVIESTVTMSFDDRAIPGAGKRADEIRAGDAYTFPSGGGPRPVSRVEVYDEGTETWSVLA